MNNNNTTITIKELYEMAKEEGYENAIIGMVYSDEDDYVCPVCGDEYTEGVEYTEEVHQRDIEFGGYYTNTGEKLWDCIWINNHPCCR